MALSPRLAVTGSLRYDHVALPFRDRLEPENSGDNRFRQLSGAIGLDHFTATGLVSFASYGRGFRAPVIMELACADPDDPCPLPYELGADPPLNPVTTDTWQLGLRHFRDHFAAELVGYWAEVYDDIFFVQPPETRAGFFQNLERTRRQGIELSLSGRPFPAFRLQGDLALTRATFQSTATLWAPYLDDDDDDDFDDFDRDDLEPPTVRPGHRFPMVPLLRAGLGADCSSRGWRAGMRLSHVGSQWLRGDEDNREPDEKLEAYALLGGRLQREFRRATLYVAAENLLDRRHATFGVLALNRLTDPLAPLRVGLVVPRPTAGEALGVALVRGADQGAAEAAQAASLLGRGSLLWSAVPIRPRPRRSARWPSGGACSS